jgi:two-component system chemotaxis sensor kinase CheA
MDKDRLVRRLMATFLGELEEHVRSLNQDLLSLEKSPEPAARAQLFTTLFRTAHSLKGAARSVNVGVIEAAGHRLEEILAAARDGVLAAGPEVIQTLFAAADAIQEAGKRLREGRELAGSSLAVLLPRLEIAAGGRASSQAQPESHVEPRRAPVAPRDDSWVRVPAEKLDELLTRSGELLVARRRTEARGDEVAALQELVERWRGEWRTAERGFKRILPRSGGKIGGPPSQKAAGGPGVLPERTALAMERNGENLRGLEKALERLADGLQADRYILEQAAAPLEEEVRRVRMLPFAQACEGLERMARDLSRAAGKDVDLVIEGGEVELDRTILEGLKDPLLHLVRNAVDHGVELPAERLAAGKPRRGRITVGAALRGTRVEVVVADDGRGLDLDAIREQARKRGLPVPEDKHEVARLIFFAGFSTSPIITELSGRGVGLDVARSRVEALHGTIDFSSEPGRATRLVLAVPLTLTTVRALLVAAGGQTLAFLTSTVERLLRVGPEDIRSVEGREVLVLGAVPVPVAPLAEVLGLPAVEPAQPGKKVPVVIVAAGDQRAAFVVDELLAEGEVVVKHLGPRLVRVRNIAGATVLPTGRVALILNAVDLVRSGLGHAAARTVSAAFAVRAPEAKRRLLVVEDSVTTRTLEKSILEAAGYDVLIAADGAEAWRILQAKGADLVVTDIEMPRMDGFALTEAIRASKRFRELPVVLVTALESERDKTRGMEAGADAYLLKSAFDQKNLLETIGHLL